MTKEEAMNLCRYYIGRAVEESGEACVRVKCRDGSWSVNDCTESVKEDAA